MNLARIIRAALGMTATTPAAPAPAITPSAAPDRPQRKARPASVVIAFPSPPAAADRPVCYFNADQSITWDAQYAERYHARRAAQKVVGGSGPRAGETNIDRRKPWQKTCLTHSFDKTGCIATPRTGPRT